jgi:trigger factor
MPDAIMLELNEENRLNIQTEQLDNHTARFTVEVEQERLDLAKRDAARKIAKQVRIPGFRKGKAPYHILIQNGLESQILNDAIENLSQDIYRDTLEQSDINPYGPGAFEDFKLEDTPVFIYTVPLQPTVELNDYKSVRVDYTEPEVTDKQVDEAMERLQEQEALVEESSQPAALGDRVTVDIHSEFVDDAPNVENEDSESDESPRRPAKGESYIHEHDAQIRLSDDRDPVLPGFKSALKGANLGDELEIELTAPDDDSDYEDIAGRNIKFHVTIKKIENLTLPTLNDELAARITKDEDEPLTLLQLRVRVRENIQEEMERVSHDSYATDVLAKIVDGANISFPEAMVDDQIDSMLKDLDNRLGQQGLNLDTYMKVMDKSEEDMSNDYREQAINIIRRSLALTEIVKQEDIDIAPPRIDERITEMLTQFGDQADSLRPMFDTPQMRSALQNDLVQQAALDYIIAIGKGEDPSETLTNSTVKVAASEESAEAEDVTPIEKATVEEAEPAAELDAEAESESPVESQ